MNTKNLLAAAVVASMAASCGWLGSENVANSGIACISADKSVVVIFEAGQDAACGTLQDESCTARVRGDTLVVRSEGRITDRQICYAAPFGSHDVECEVVGDRRGVTKLSYAGRTTTEPCTGQ